MKTEREINDIRDKLERFRKEKHRQFGGTDYPRLRGWIDALSWVLSNDDHITHIKKKFSQKVIKLLSSFE